MLEPLSLISAVPDADLPALYPGGMPWQEALAIWLHAKHSDSARTQVTYRAQVAAFFTTPGAPDLADLRIAHLEAYRGALVARCDTAYVNTSGDARLKRLSAATVQLRLSVLRQFLDYCRRRSWLWAPDEVTLRRLRERPMSHEQIVDALERVKATIERPYEVLDSDDDRARLIAAAGAVWDNRLRNQALVALLIGSGLRIAEACALRLTDIRRDGDIHIVSVQGGKGHKDRSVPLDASAYRLIVDYVAASGRTLQRSETQPDAPLFLARDYRGRTHPLTPSWARRIVKASADRAGLTIEKRITPHTLRHDYAVNTLRGDAAHGRPPADLVDVQALLGHASIQTTARYTRHDRLHRLAQFAPVVPTAPTGKAGID